MFVAISPDYEFCGWKGLPFCLRNKVTKTDTFLEREQFEFLYRCDGTRDIDLDSIPEEKRIFVGNLIVDGVLQKCDPQDSARIPDYKKYPCRYRAEVQWSITGKCNYKCKHCFQSAPQGIFGQPTLDECLDIIDQLAECGVSKVSITGGEPLIREDFWQIVDALLARDIMVSTIYTNGALVNRQFIDGLKQRKMHPSFQVSFDGIGWHDWVRGVEGAERMALDAMELLISEGYAVGTAYTLVKGNVDAFRPTMNMLADMGITSVKTGYTMPQGEWLEHFENYLTSSEELEFYKTYLPQYLEDGRPLGLQCEGVFMGTSPKQVAQEEDLRKRKEASLLAIGFTQEEIDREAESAQDEKDMAKGWSLMLSRSLEDGRLMSCDACEVLRTSFYIGPTGVVLPCMSLEGTPAGDRFPNIFQQRLASILGEESYFIRMSGATVGDVYEHDPECMTCEHRGRCCAGCRAMAVGAKGEDYLARDRRTCMIVKENWTGQIEEAILACQGRMQ